MTAALRRAGCILAYDQACVDEACCHADRRLLAEGAAAFSCGGAIAVAWFDVLLNYGLVVLNAAMAVILSRALWERGASEESIPSIWAAGLFASRLVSDGHIICPSDVHTNRASHCVRSYEYQIISRHLLSIRHMQLQWRPFRYFSASPCDAWGSPSYGARRWGGCSCR